MHGMSVYGRATSSAIALASTLSGFTFFAQASERRVSRLSSKSTPLRDVSPTIDSLSQQESAQTNTLADLVDLRKNETTYTQKQLECAERRGIDPSECSREGTLIKVKENLDKIFTVQKNSDGDVTPQQACANRLDVDLEHCNAHGVFTNRLKQIADKILTLLKVQSWNNVTPDDLAGIEMLELMKSDITFILGKDLDGLTGVTTLNLSENQLISVTLSETLTSLFSLDLELNQLITLILPNTLTDLHYLFLTFNRLRSLTIPDTLIKLKTINLSYNLMRSFIIPDTLVELDFLALNNNQLLSLTIPSKLISLQRLNLDNNLLSSFTVHDTLTALRKLSIKKNHLTSLILPNRLPFLDYLRLDENNLRSITIPERLISLEWIGVSNNLLTSLTIPYKLENLRRLDIAYNRLSNLTISEDILKKLQTRELLYASFTNENVSISYNIESDILFGSASSNVIYDWKDIRDVFKDGIINSTTTHDTLQISQNFQFPAPDLLSAKQIQFISDFVSKSPSLPKESTENNVPTKRTALQNLNKIGTCDSNNNPDSSDTIFANLLNQPTSLVLEFTSALFCIVEIWRFIKLTRRSSETMRQVDIRNQIKSIESASIPHLIDINKLIRENKQMVQLLQQHLMDIDQTNEGILSLLEDHQLMSTDVNRVIDPITLDIMTIPVRCYTSEGDQSYSDLYSIKAQLKRRDRDVIDPLTRNVIIRIECDSERLRFIHSTLKELSKLLRIDFKIST